MDIAKSMFLGRRYVDVEVCDYNSYKELGLKCIECGEEVIIKKGNIRKHHFAHRQEHSKLGVEECKLRTQNYISSFYERRDKIVENKNQRSKILEDYFYYLITIYKKYYVKNFDEKCKKWYKKLKNKLQEYQINDHINNKYIGIDYFISEALKILQKNKNDKTLYEFTKLAKIKNSSFTQDKISLEAIDFLLLKSKSDFLEKIIKLSLFDLLYKGNCTENFDLIYKNIKNELIKPINICDNLIEIIISNPWEKALNLIVLENLILADKNKSILNDPNVFCNKYIPYIPYNFIEPKYKEVTLIILEKDDLYDSLGNFITSANVDVTENELYSELKKQGMSIVGSTRYKLDKEQSELTKATRYLLASYEGYSGLLFLKNESFSIEFTSSLKHGLVIHSKGSHIKKLKEFYSWCNVTLEATATYENNFILAIMLVTHLIKRSDNPEKSSANLKDWLNVIKRIVDFKNLSTNEHIKLLNELKCFVDIKWRNEHNPGVNFFKELHESFRVIKHEIKKIS